MLDPCPGPDCPDCGCNDVRVIAPPSPGSWFARAGRAKCKHCGRVFAVQPPSEQNNPRPTLEPEPMPVLTCPPPITTPIDGAGVVYHILRCPGCRSDDVQTTSTRRPIRYHKCRACGETFKSVEHDQ